MPPRPLVLLAASGLAREAISAIASSREYLPIALLDDDPSRWGSTVGSVPVDGGIEQIADLPADVAVLICAGSGRARRSIANRLRGLGLDADRFATVVHPDASVGTGTQVGRGSIVLGGVVLTADVAVGDHVVAMPNAVLTHDCSVGDYATICAGVVLGGSVRVGEGAYLGMNASVRQGLVIGAEAVLGMGSVLLENLPAAQTWVGVPARAITRSVSESHAERMKST